MNFSFNALWLQTKDKQFDCCEPLQSALQGRHYHEFICLLFPAPLNLNQENHS